MSLKLKKSDLQTKYKYLDKRDKGDSSYTGKLDRIKIDKDEEYEVLPFLQALVDELDITDISDVNKLEDILQSDDLSAVVMRDELSEKIISTYKIRASLGL